MIVENNKSNRQDREANYFARCLLMPRVLIVNELSKRKYKNKDAATIITLISKAFQVDYIDMRYRLIELELMDSNGVIIL